MNRPKCYSPQLSREIVSRLYLKAKAERIPMTRLANRIMEQALEAQGNAKRPPCKPAQPYKAEARS
jgi:hypothetical protein